jgi:hypothetical protein
MPRLNLFDLLRLSLDPRLQLLVVPAFDEVSEDLEHASGVAAESELSADQISLAGAVADRRLDVKKRVGEEQTIGFLKEAERGIAVKEWSRK